VKRSQFLDNSFFIHVRADYSVSNDIRESEEEAEKEIEEKEE
jgi:hypothetical protein